VRGIQTSALVKNGMVADYFHWASFWKARQKRDRRKDDDCCSSVVPTSFGDCASECEDVQELWIVSIYINLSKRN
jgi:hypothetical protein